MLDNYPPGAANDPRAPYNEPVYPERTMIVEVGATIGTMVEVDIEGWYDEDGNFEYDDTDLMDKVGDKIIDKFKIDGKNHVLNDIEIWDSREV